jgi:uncharacterized protein YbcI
LADSPTPPQIASAISDAIVGLHVRYYGKGPRTAKTYVQGDFVFCVLEEPFTAAEHTLIEAGSYGDVRAMHQAFQDAMGVTFSRAVWEITERNVVAFISQIHTGPDLAIEIFQLAEPEEMSPLTS